MTGICGSCTLDVLYIPNQLDEPHFLIYLKWLPTKVRENRKKCTELWYKGGALVGQGKSGMSSGGGSFGEQIN